MIRFLRGALVVLVLAGCHGAGDAAPIVKIGVIAPFEGLGRPLGYALLPEVQTLVSRANADGSLGRYRVAVVAFNDDLYGPSAEAQAHALALDPDVMAVIGPWTGATAQAVTPVLDSAGLSSASGALLDDPHAPTAHTSCPTPQTIALTLLARSDGLDSPVVLAGPDNPLSRALLAANPGLVVGQAPPTVSPSATVIHTGDAEQAADDVVRWRADGWEGTLLGGPDLAQPWFADRAGESAASAYAVACGITGTGDPAGEDGATAAVVESARLATGAVLDALAQELTSRAAPDRGGVAQILAAESWPGEWHWLEISGGEWRPEARGLTE